MVRERDTEDTVRGIGSVGTGLLLESILKECGEQELKAMGDRI